MSGDARQTLEDGRTGGEFRIFGPPGTGKTTYLSRQIERVVEKYGPDSALVTSYTKAAAAELVSRDLPLDRDRIGTLHAFAFRMLGRPTIAETKAEDWNREHPDYPITRGGIIDVDESGADLIKGLERDGDRYLTEVNRLRNTLRPIALWPDPKVIHFYRDWHEWKKQNKLLDFTDMLEIANNDFSVAPGEPNVVFADEAQDLTPLQLSIVRKWGQKADYFVVVGDDDQCLFDFTGASGRVITQPEIESSRKIVLSQSFRVPRAVHALAMRWILNVKAREPKEYLPVNREGRVIHARDGGSVSHDTFKTPDRILDDAERRIGQGQTCMFLVSCGYMLSTIIKGLRDRGIPYWNPYRRKRGDWNPLRPGGKVAVTAADRVTALLAAHGDAGRPWTAPEFRSFMDWTKAALVRGVKAELKELPGDRVVTTDDLRRWMPPEHIEKLPALLNGPPSEFLNWWLSHVTDEHQRLARYVCRIASWRGQAALYDAPKAIVGTIHSVKGGEADTVYLFPDLSNSGDYEWQQRSPLSRDPIYRQFYVGMTRAKDTLAICGAATPQAVW